MRRDALDPFAQIAAAAGASSVTVLEGGKGFRISGTDPQAHEHDPLRGVDEASIASAEANEAVRRAQDARGRAQAAAEEARIQRLEAGLADLKDAILQVLAGQAKIEELLAMDTVAHYDDKGRVLYARREPRKER